MKEMLKKTASICCSLLLLLCVGCSTNDPITVPSNDSGKKPSVITGETNSYYGTWASSQYLTESSNMPPVSLESHTLRQIVHTSIAGNAIRLKFSNRLGGSVMELSSVHIALSKGSGAIDSSTDTIVTFDGATSVSIAAGNDVVSDTFVFDLPAVSDVAVSVYFGSVPSSITGHPGSRTTSYIMSDNVVSAASCTGASTCDHWYAFSGIDIYSTDSYRTVVCFGDSITDGRGTTTNAQNRWTDNFASILQQNDETKNVGVINEGIGGTLVSSSGTERFVRDVISQPGVKYMIMLYGVNDIMYGGSSAATITSTYKSLIKKAHAAGILAYGCTILPFGSCSSFNTSFESVRTSVNDWIVNTSSDDGGFDGVIDFASALQDQSDNTKLATAYDSGDGLHPGPAGYVKMAQTIDTSLCTSTKTPTVTAAPLTITTASTFTYDLPSTLNVGDVVTVHIVGTNAGTTGFRSWLINNNAYTMSNIYSDTANMTEASFDKTYDLTVQDKDSHGTTTATKLYFKGPTYNTAIKDITVTAVSVTINGATTTYDPSEAVIAQ